MDFFEGVIAFPYLKFYPVLDSQTAHFMAFDLLQLKNHHLLNLLECIASFANSQGGTIWFGFNRLEQGVVAQGILLSELDKQNIKKVVNRLSNRLYPRLRTAYKQIRIEFIPLQVNERPAKKGLFILAIRVQASLFVLHSFKILNHKNDAVHLFFKRKSGFNSIISSFEQICRIIRQRQRKRHQRSPPTPSKAWQSNQSPQSEWVLFSNESNIKYCRLYLRDNKYKQNLVRRQQILQRSIQQLEYSPVTSQQKSHISQSRKEFLLQLLEISSEGSQCIKKTKSQEEEVVLIESEEEIVIDSDQEVEQLRRSDLVIVQNPIRKRIFQ